MQAGDIVYDVEINTRELLRGEQQATRALDNLDSGIKQVDRTSQSATGSLSGLARAIKAVLAAAAVRQMAAWVQEYQTMAERVQMATSSTEEFEYVQRRLQSTADGTYRALSEAQEIFIQTASSLRSMGYEASDMLDITDSLSYAFVRSATSQERARVAMGAFSRSLAKGRVDADAWEMILVSIPDIADQLADSMKKSAQEVRALGAAGKLTTVDLTEGLRHALEENRAASDAMATDLIDAGVRIQNALTTVLVGLEKQTGALQSFTDGIIGAAEAMLAFGNDADRLASFLTVVQVAGASTAAMFAGRFLTAMGASTAAFYQSTIAARAKAAADVAAAQTAVVLSAEQLIQAKTAEQLAAAQAQATAATNALTAAQGRLNSIATVGTRVLGGLRNVMAFLGGPTGVILIAAAALLTFHRRVQDARNSTLELSDSVKGLTAEMRELERVENQKRIDKETKSLERQNAALQRNARLRPHADRGAAATQKFEEDQLRRQVAIQKTEQRIAALLKRQQQLANANLPRHPTVGGTERPDDWRPTAGGTDEETQAQKRLATMRAEIELAKRVGEARARLRAVQSLGADATEEERAEAEQLASELYRLEQAHDAAKRAAEEAKRQSEDYAEALEKNVDVLADLNERLYQSTLNAGELAQRQAELQLNEYATPEQIQQARDLALALYEVNDQATRARAFGTDVAGKIRGDVSPLSGGRFDDGTERYEAERLAEQQRYAEQLERLKEAEALKLEVEGGYDKLREEMYQQHVDRMNHIDRVRQEAQLDMWSSGFGQMATDLQEFAQVFAGEHKAMFKISQAAAIAQTIIDTYKGAQAAFSAMASIPVVGPALGAAAAAAAVAGGMARVASIRSQSMSGRMHGGPVDPSRMYRINEGGAPEVFNAANGMQYMLPNQRGEVVSNRDSRGGGGGVTVLVNVHTDPARAGEVEQTATDDREQIIDIFVADVMGDGRSAQAIQSKWGLNPQGR